MFTFRLALLTMKWIETIVDSYTVEFTILTLLMLVLGLIRQSEYARVALFLRSFSNASLISQQVREEKAFNRIAIPIFFLVVAIMSFFFGKMFHHFNLLVEWTFISLFFIIYAGLLILTGLRALIYFSLSELFNLGYIHRVHSFHWLLNNFILSLIILALNIVYSFGPKDTHSMLIYSGLIALFFLSIMRSIRVFALFIAEARIPLFYNVLYLCALEFLPPLIVGAAVYRATLG